MKFKIENPTELATQAPQTNFGIWFWFGEVWFAAFLKTNKIRQRYTELIKQYEQTSELQGHFATKEAPGPAGPSTPLVENFHVVWPA
jgi:hypothetical protein